MKEEQKSTSKNKNLEIYDESCLSECDFEYGDINSICQKYKGFNPHLFDESDPIKNLRSFEEQDETVISSMAPICLESDDEDEIEDEGFNLKNIKPDFKFHQISGPNTDDSWVQDKEGDEDNEESEQAQADEFNQNEEELLLNSLFLDSTSDLDDLESYNIQGNRNIDLNKRECISPSPKGLKKAILIMD